MNAVEKIVVPLLWANLIVWLVLLFADQIQSPVVGVVFILCASLSTQLLKPWHQRRRLFRRLQTSGQSITPFQKTQFLGLIDTATDLSKIRIPTSGRFLGFIPELETWRITSHANVDFGMPLDERKRYVVVFSGTPTSVEQHDDGWPIDRAVTIERIESIVEFNPKSSDNKTLDRSR